MTNVSAIYPGLDPVKQESLYLLLTPNLERQGVSIEILIEVTTFSIDYEKLINGSKKFAFNKKQLVIVLLPDL